MKEVKVYQFDAFSKKPNKGNPAGIVLNGNFLTDKEMQEVALNVGFSETAFVKKSKESDFNIRYFTPGQEVNLCGHATIATIYALKTKGLLPEKTKITIETLAGNLPIKISTHLNGAFEITMSQASPKFKPYHGLQDELLNAIGLAEEDLEDRFPILYGSTGSWTLVLPIKKLSSFNKMKPNNEIFPTILKEMPRASIHPFCLETYDPAAHIHTRHFSSPYSGITEDPVTGTAAGVMGAYYAKYIQNQFESKLSLTIEQGQEMNKDGRVNVDVLRMGDTLGIEITGTSIFVKEINVLI